MIRTLDDAIKSEKLISHQETFTNIALSVRITARYGGAMLVAILLGIWMLVSIVATPLIGYFLSVTNTQLNIPTRSTQDSRVRPAVWAYGNSRRQETPRRVSLVKPHGREVRSPRAG